MRGFARHLLTSCRAASLVICVATCALWARSGSTWDLAAWRTSSGGEFEARSASGVIELAAATGLEPGDGYHFIESMAKPEPFDWSKVPADVLGVVTWEMMFWGDFVWDNVWRWEVESLGSSRAAARTSARTCPRHGGGPSGCPTGSWQRSWRCRRCRPPGGGSWGGGAGGAGDAARAATTSGRAPGGAPSAARRTARRAA
jgi:hypothetical protein